MKNLTTKKAYFRGNAKFGRTTQLIEKSTGAIIFEAMGICTKSELIAILRTQPVSKSN